MLCGVVFHLFCTARMKLSIDALEGRFGALGAVFRKIQATGEKTGLVRGTPRGGFR